jgi:hypothetical protein
VSPLLVRILAVLAAIAMVVVALVARQKLDDRNSVRNTVLRITCTPELETPCRDFADTSGAKVDVTIEEAGVTVDKLATASEAPFDGWLTPGPFPQMVQEARRSAGRPVLIDRVSRPIARSRIGIVMWKERAGALGARCPEKGVGWRCLGDAAGRQWSDVGGKPTWGTVKTALPDPLTSASGLVALGAGTAGFFGQADVSLQDVQDSVEYSAWLNNLARANQNLDVGRMLAAGPSLVDAVVTLEATSEQTVEQAAGRDPVSVIYPSPVATADVVLGTVGSKSSTRLATLLEGTAGRDALARARWKVDFAGLPPTSNLPSPGLLLALRGMWHG